MQKYIIIEPCAGLANRMRAIAGANELAEKTNSKLIVIWVRNTDLYAKFSDLFMPISAKVIEFNGYGYMYKIYRHIINRVNHIYIDDNKIENEIWQDIEKAAEKLKDKNILIYGCLNITRSLNYSFFKPSRRIAKLLNLNINKNVNGIHIRRTDNWVSTKYSPTSLFINKIKEDLDKNPNQKFYLATDDKNEEKNIKEKFPNNIITHNKQSLDRTKKIGIIDSMIDLCHLSMCGKIYGSYYSSFSNVAARWHGINKYILQEGKEEICFD